MPQSFSTSLPIQVFLRPPGSAHTAWTELDYGPGVFQVPDDMEAAVRARQITDRELAQLAADLTACAFVTALNLSENRKVTEKGVLSLAALKQLTWLSLSSCDLTNLALASVAALTRLEHLDISYLNRVTDPGLKPLTALTHLRYLDLLGCIKITHAGVTRLEQNKNLIIRK